MYISGVESGSGTAPGVYLREDPICGTQLENQSELRAPTADRATYYLDAAIAARTQLGNYIFVVKFCNCEKAVTFQEKCQYKLMDKYHFNIVFNDEQKTLGVKRFCTYFLALLRFFIWPSFLRITTLHDRQHFLTNWEISSTINKVN